MMKDQTYRRMLIAMTLCFILGTGGIILVVILNSLGLVGNLHIAW